jgi:hypothetical protein
MPPSKPRIEGEAGAAAAREADANDAAGGARSPRRAHLLRPPASFATVDDRRADDALRPSAAPAGG